MKIMIDPGHGGTDPGTSGHGYKEKDVVLEAALYIGKRLEELGADVRYTRTSDTDAGDVLARGKSAAGCDYLLSVHCNGYRGTAHGSEVWCQGAEKYAYTESRFAELLGQFFRWRGVKSAPLQGEPVVRGYDEARMFWQTYDFADYYGVLRGAASVGVSADLLELFFLTSKDDLDTYLANKEDILEGVVRAVCESYGVAYTQGGGIDYRALYLAAQDKLERIRAILEE